MSQQPLLLVSAGEASADTFAARVLARLKVSAAGLGGPALREQGCKILVDQATVAALGPVAALARAVPLFNAWQTLVRLVRQRRPQAALLVGFSEFNARLGPRLRAEGIPVFWYSPPQVWAWRQARGPRLARAADAFGLLLPFELAVWNRWTRNAFYVGHPALDLELTGRAEARASLRVCAQRELIALLPGSRAHELRAHLPLLLAAWNLMRQRRPGAEACLLLAPGLEPRIVTWAQRLARASQVQPLCQRTSSVLAAFDLALAVSGTVTLEAALAGVPSVIVYRPGRVTEWWLRRNLKVPWVGLPNLLLGEPVFPELLGHAARPEAIAERACALLSDPERARWAGHRLRELFTRSLLMPPSARVAELVSGWIS